MYACISNGAQVGSSHFFSFHQRYASNGQRKHTRDRDGNSFTASPTSAQPGQTITLTANLTANQAISGYPVEFSSTSNAVVSATLPASTPTAITSTWTVPTGTTPGAYPISLGVYNPQWSVPALAYATTTVNVTSPNLLPNANFTNGTSPWVMGTAIVVPDPNSAGINILRVKGTAGWTDAYIDVSSLVKPGSTYTLTALARSSGAGVYGQIGVQSIASNWTTISDPLTTTISTSFRTYSLQVTIPSNAKYVHLTFIKSGGANSTAYADFENISFTQQTAAPAPLPCGSTASGQTVTTTVSMTTGSTAATIQECTYGGTQTTTTTVTQVQLCTNGNLTNQGNSVTTITNNGSPVCNAPPTSVNGACGSANGTTSTTAPVANLCSSGTASIVAGSGPWTWSCSGANGGSTAACSAPITTTTPADKPGPSATLYNKPFYTCSKNYYVSTTGNDTNPGTQAAPWLTIQHADDVGRQAGDCVNVAPGTYQANITLVHGGNAPTPTGYVAYRCQTLDGCHVLAPTTGGHLWTIATPANYIAIDGFEVDGNSTAANPDGTADACIQSGWDDNRWLAAPHNDSSHHIWVLNNIVHHCNLTGISFSNKEWYYILHNKVYHNSWTSGYEGSGISLVVLQCIESGNASCSASTGGTAGSGTYVPSGMDLTYMAPFHIVISGNDVYDNSEAHDPISCGGHTDGNGIILDTWFDEPTLSIPFPNQSLVEGNLSHANGGRGIHVFATSNATVANNTAYGNGLDTCINGYYLADLSQSGGVNNVWINNVAQSVLTPVNPGCGGKLSGTTYCGGRNAPLVAGSARGVTDANNTFLNNVLYGGDGVQLFDGDVNSFSTAKNKVNTNPLLVSPSTSNFALGTGSPAIGYGVVQPYLPASAKDAGACGSSLTTCP